MGATRATFPPLITASTWETAWASCHEAAAKANGSATGTPSLTNGDAIQLVMGWPKFPLWAQYAAVAYGWSPKVGIMDITQAQQAKSYPSQIGKELWQALRSLASDLDAHPGASPRLDLARTFDDVAVQGEVAAQLKQDGAAVTFRINGGQVAPKVKPKKPSTPAWVTLAWVYFGYRVLKNLTGGSKYTG